MYIDQNKPPENCLYQFGVKLHTLVSTSPAMQSVEPLNYASGVVRWAGDVTSRISYLESRLRINNIRSERAPIKKKRINLKRK